MREEFEIRLPVAEVGAALGAELQEGGRLVLGIPKNRRRRQLLKAKSSVVFFISMQDIPDVAATKARELQFETRAALALGRPRRALRAPRPRRPLSPGSFASWVTRWNVTPWYTFLGRFFRNVLSGFF